jgi:serine/threonine protein kinase
MVDFAAYRQNLIVDQMATSCPDWYRVAIKKMVPTRLDTGRGRVRIVTYDDAEAYISEIKALIRLCKESDDECGIEANPSDVVQRRNSRPVVFLYEYFWTGTEVLMVTEILETDLTQWIRKQDVLTEIIVLQIAHRVAEALCFIHSRGVVHRDIKMQNIMFKDPSDIRTIKLVDFGLAKIFHDEADRVSDFCGSP